MAAAVLNARPLGQPDIDYAPDLDKYLARVARRQKSEQLGTELPPGFPKQLESDLVWNGADVAEKYNFVYELNAEELQEIEEALVYFKCKHCLFIKYISGLSILQR